MRSLIAAIVLSTFLVGVPVHATEPRKSTIDRCEITDHGNGVLYFGCGQKAGFGDALSVYRVANPHKEIVSVAADNSMALGGATIGYFVILRQK
jgi:hypothetical protein